MLFAFYALPRPLRNPFLLIANLVFYGWGEPVYVLLMVFATVVNFILGGLSTAGARCAPAWRARASAPPC